MARTAKPWFREDRGEYFVTIRGVRHRLGPDKDAAYRRFHELMAAVPVQKAVASADGLSVAALFDKFLDWTQRHRAAATYDWYLKYTQDFVNSLADPHMPGVAVRPFHVTEWADGHTGWGDTCRQGAIIGVQRAFNWAVKLGHLDRNPVAGVEKPRARRREQAIGPTEFAEILSHYAAGDPFRDLLDFCWDTGCRPQEAKRVEARHLVPGTVVFPPEEAKGKRRHRRILLTPAAEALVKRLAEVHPDGPLFRNEDGNPWTSYAVACRFARLRQRLGEAELRRRGEDLSDDEVAAAAATLSRTKTVGGRTVRKSEKELLRECGGVS